MHVGLTSSKQSPWPQEKYTHSTQAIFNTSCLFLLYTDLLSGLLFALTFFDCSPAPSLYFSTSSLSTGIKHILLINVLAASLSWLIEPSRGQDPYSCNVSEYCTAPVFFISVFLSFLLSPSHCSLFILYPPRLTSLDGLSTPEANARSWPPS